MKHLVDIAFSGFWQFVGMFILFSSFLTFLMFLWNRFWRHWNIRKHGYPPPYCDADGDFPKTEKD
jgi:hypothetical protein